MKLTEIQIQPIKPRDGLIAFASVVVDDSLYLGSIGIHKKLDGSGYRLTYPTKFVGSKSFNIFHPIKSKLSLAIEEAVLNKFKKVMKGVNDRYSSFNITNINTGYSA